MNNIELLIFLIILAISFYSYLFKVFFDNKDKKNFFYKLHSNNLVTLHPEFEKLYNEIKNNSFFEEVERYKTKAENSILWGGFVFIGLILFLLLVMDISRGMVLILAIFFAIYMITLPASLYHKYNHLYKTTIILPLVEKISKTLKYSYDDGSPTEEAYKASNLETSYFNKYISDDYMYGSIKGYNFNLTNIHTQHIKESDIGKMITHLFNGIFIYSYTPTNIDYQFKFLNKKLMYAPANFEVSVPDVRFTKHFRLFAENQDAVLDIFNEDLLNLLDSFMTNYGVPFDLSVNKNAFYFRFYTGTSFENPLFKKSQYMYTLNIYYCIIDFVIQFISTFKKYN